MSFIRRFLLALIFTIFFGLVIYLVEPPKSWGEASYFQILIFFIPYVVFITYLSNLFLNNLLRSFATGLGFVMIALLLATNQFNYLTLSLVILVTILLFWFIPKSRKRFNLGKDFKIPRIKPRR